MLTDTWDKVDYINVLINIRTYTLMVYVLINIRTYTITANSGYIKPL